MSDRAFEKDGEEEGKKSDLNKPRSAHPVLDSFGRNLNDLARSGKLDPVVGCDEQIEQLEHILNKRKKNSALIIGDPGVGKSALVEGLAIKIYNKQTDRSLWDKKIIDLNMSLIVSGTKYRGQFEERMTAIINELKENPNVIVFIDELHTVIGAGGASGSMDASNMLKPTLARGEIRCIGATTLEDYKKHLESDQAFDRRFQKVRVYPPSTAKMFDILKEIRPKYEEFHSVTYDDESLKIIINLCDRYIPYRNFPDKAIDIMDEAGSFTKIKGVEEPEICKQLEVKLREITAQKIAFATQQKYEEAARMRDEERTVKSELDGHYKAWKEERSKNKTPVGLNSIAAVISKHSGIPLESITKGELEKLRGLEDELNRKVIGQDHVVKKVVQAVKRNKMGIHDPNKPFVMLFLGKTGTGKTFLAKALAKYLFDLDDAFVRINMSEYMERNDVSKLIGSPPGYVGYDDKGVLTEAVKNNPYCLILLDEIEKAHPEVFNIFLQVFDDGVLTDSHGMDINFKNTTIIMTSNIGTRDLMVEDVGFDIGGDLDMDTEERVFKELKKSFPPELINRFDEKLVFRTLNEKDAEKIVELELEMVKKRLLEKDLKMNYKPSLVAYLSENGFDELYGARPLKRLIVSIVENEVAQCMLDEKIKAGDEFMIGYDSKKNKVVLNVVDKK